jgi:hypothetical protein
MSICPICTGRHDESECPKGIVYVHQCRPIIRPEQRSWDPLLGPVQVLEREPQRTIRRRMTQVVAGRAPAIRGIRVG